ncbi:MAG TPA: hypothetical protein VK203_06165 [Nostocaceae cyanobacterium]|nr:hypothetical protein [Nostocaceae cyanobacterium]
MSLPIFTVIDLTSQKYLADGRKGWTSDRTSVQRMNEEAAMNFAAALNKSLGQVKYFTAIV